MEMECNYAETTGAQSFSFRSTTRILDREDAEKPAAPAAQPFLFTYSECTEAPAWTITMDDNRLFDVVRCMVSIAEQGSAINPSAFYDSFLKHARFLVIFAVFLLGRYVSHIPLYLVVFCISLISLLFLYLYIHYVPFLFLEDDIMWIRRESRLLNAISEDAAKVAGLRDQIDTRAKEILDPSIYSGGATIIGLNDVEGEWVAKTRSVVERANALVATFENQRRRDSHMIHIIRFGTISEKVKQVEWLLTETKQVKEEINERIKMKEDRGINICESLERSRSKMRSLVDRPIYEISHQKKWVESKRRIETSAALTFSIAKKMNSLMTQEPDEQIHSIYLQLMLLYPFLKDIEEVRFESEIEEAWVEEMEEVINQAQPAIDSFLLHRPEHRFKWLSIIDNWKARRKLKEDIRCIDSRFRELLERKERYGFGFIRRDSSKFVNQSPHRSTRDGIISPVAGTIHSYLEAKPDISVEVHRKLRSLCTHLDNMNKLIDDAGMIERRYISRMAWLEQMSNIVKRAENSVQTFMKSSKNIRIKQIHFRTSAGTKLWREIGQMENTINLVMRSVKAYGIEFRKESNSVVGLEEDVQEVVSGLTTNNEHHVISILGIGGIGKTTLAKEIYNHADVSTHFPQRVWISLPWKSSESWVQTVRDNVRYLLVVDNISTKEELEAALTVGSQVASPSGSRILLTTRDTNLVSEVGSPPHYLRLRTKEESWKLLNQMVHFHPKEEVKAKEILGKCGGFPLAIVRLGYVIARNAVNNVEDLERMIKQKEKPMLETYCTLESIKDRLPESDPDMFRCLSYLKLFPVEIEIPTRRFIALWIAEGLVKVEKKQSLESEDVADKYLTELINRDMIQVVERKLNGTVKTCRLPYSLQKLELYKNPERIVNFKRNYAGTTSIPGKSSNFRNEYQGLLSILTFDTREGNKPGEEAGNFLKKGVAGGCFRKLQVLDLERLFRPELPNMLGTLSELRYLGLRWTCLGSIPPSIGELVKLQTLDVKHTSVRTLPSSIWKLQELRNLYLNQNCRSRLEHHQGGSSLKNLRTLWGVFVDKDSPLKDGLDKVTNLRKLGLAFQLEQEEQKALANWIKKLKRLKSLRIRSVGEKGKPCDLMCMPLSGLNSLSSLNLFGKLTSSIIAEFPKNLTDLTLSASSLKDDPMPKLEKLSNLKLLCFYSHSYRGKGMRCAAEGFPQLLVLRLWNLVELEVWDVEEKAMQNLRELEIRSCKNLKVPTGLSHLKTLLELKLTDMPQDFVADYQKLEATLG